MRSIDLSMFNDPNDSRYVPRTKTPWYMTYYRIRERCINPRHTIYSYYGGRGIKCRITGEEIKELWFRDRAYLMKRPSIDRVNTLGDYEYSNCRFLELSKNVGRFNSEKTHCKHGHELTPDNIYTTKGRACRICAIARAENQNIKRRENTLLRKQTKTRSK